MITTVCMNPSFDKTVEVDHMILGDVNRIKSIRLDMGGKGLNVAAVVHRLGLEVQCLGCMGEDGADRLTAMMEAEGISHRFLTVPGAVRTNTKVVSRDGQGVTELNEPGARMDETQLQTFMELAQEYIPDGSTAVLTGSLPPGCPRDTYRQLMQRMPHVRWILDADGEPLLSGVQAYPFLIKPNLTELQSSLGRTLTDITSICDGAMEFVRRGAEHVVVSMGGKGAVCVSAKERLYAPQVEVEVKSTVGAGDAMVGGILKGLEESGDMAYAFRCGIAAGTASVMTEGTQLIRTEDFARILEQVRVQEV